MPEPITLDSLNHVSRQTKRLAESRKFYAEVLGFREISRPGFNFEGAWLYGAGIQIHLIGDGSASDPTPEINTRANHIAFAVADVDVMEQRLKALGVPYRRNVIPDRGIHQLFFQDPDGHTIELGRYGAIDQ